MLKFTEAYREFNGGSIADEQIEGIDFLLSHTEAILSFGTGYGKTLTSLTAAKILLDTFPKAKCLISCPVKATKIFKKELFSKMNIPQEQVGIISTEEFEFDQYRNRYILVTDTNVGKYPGLMDEITRDGSKVLLMIDEAHKLQDKNSLIYGTLSEIKERAMATWAITATPLLQDLESLFNIVNFVSPNFLGTKTKFLNTYTISRLKDIWVKGGTKRKVRDIIGYRNLDHLQEKLKDLVLVRQKQYNLKIGQSCRELTDEEKEVYERVSEGIFEDQERTFSRRLHDLQRLVDNSYEEDSGIISVVNQKNPNKHSTKEEMFIDAMEAVLSKGFATIVYADYHDTVHRLESVLETHKKQLGYGKIHKITGKVAKKVREEVEDAIQSNDIILITSAGSESINLQKANCVMFYDIPYSVKTIIQVIGRICRRDTQWKYQYIMFLYTKGTIDEYKYLLFRDNLELVKSVVGVGNELPLSALNVDRKNMQVLRDKLLWHYKNTPDKIQRKKTQTLKKNIVVCSADDYLNTICSYRLSILPDRELEDTTPIACLTPDSADMSGYLSGVLPFTMFRHRYIEKIQNNPTALRDIERIQKEAVEHGSVIALVGDAKIGETLKKIIVSTYKP